MTNEKIGLSTVNGSVTASDFQPSAEFVGIMTLKSKKKKKIIKEEGVWNEQ